MNTHRKDFEDTLQQIAYHLGHEYGLKDGDFVIRYFPPKKLGGQGWLAKWGQIYRLYWSLDIEDDVEKFDAALRRALKAIAWLKKNKRTDLQMWDGLKHPPADVPNAYRQLYDLPPILDHTEVEYELFYKVVMKHRMTGVVVEQEHPVTKGVNKLVYKARESLTELVTDVVKQLMEAQAAKEEAAQQESAQSAGGPSQMDNEPNFIETHPLSASDSYLTTNDVRSE